MSIYNHSFLGSAGQEIHMNDFRGKTLLLVNTASRCGFTEQYRDLEAFYREHKEKGFEIIAFPCGQFGGQEPGGTEEILEFCETNYNITFTIALKSWVNGEKATNIYKYLKEVAKDGQDISWNFEKFLVLRDGSIQNFTPDTTIADLEDIILKDLG